MRTSQLIIAGDGCGVQGDFFPRCIAMENIRCDVTVMKIFGLTNKSDRMSTKNIFFHVCYLYFCVFVVT